MNYYEIDFGYAVENDRICIKGLREPTIAEANEFCKADVKRFGAEVTKVTPIEKNEAEAFYDFSNEAVWPVFGKKNYIIRKSNSNFIPYIQDYDVIAVMSDGTEIPEAVHICKVDAERWTACGNVKWE